MIKDWDKVIAEALEQPTTQESTGCLACVTCGELANEWQGLSDIELSLLAEKYTGADGLDVVDYGYAIEAKLKELNT